MRHFSLIIIFFFLTTAILSAQNVQFSDTNLLQYLLAITVDTDGDYISDSSIDINNDGLIQNSEALLVTGIRFANNPNMNPTNIVNLSGMESFSNLEYLQIQTLGVQMIDFSIWPMLKEIDISSNYDFILNNPDLRKFGGGTSNPNNLIDFTHCPALEEVTITTSNFNSNPNSVIFSTHPNLTYLRLSRGSYQNLDISGLTALEILYINEYDGQTLNLSNQINLKRLELAYTSNLTDIIGLSSMPLLGIVEIDYTERLFTNMQPPNLNLTFDGSRIFYLRLYGVNDLTITNNITPMELRYDIRDVFGDLTITDIDIINTNDHTSITLYLGDTSSIYMEDFRNLDEIAVYEYDAGNLDLSRVDFSVLRLNSCDIGELNIKNGHRLTRFSSGYQNFIDFICINANDEQTVRNGLNNHNQNTVVHPYCSFVPGGQYSEIQGAILSNLSSAGCVSNQLGDYIELKFTLTNGSVSDIFYPHQDSLHYAIPEGNHTLTAELIDQNYWTVSPNSIQVNFPTQSSPFTQDFCVTPNGTIEDLEIIVTPLEQARPGFETDYKVVVKNKGNQNASGTVTLDYDADYMTLFDSAPAAGTANAGQLDWSFTDIAPFQMEEYRFTMTLNTPMDSSFPLNGDDELSFTGTVMGSGTDNMPEDNTMTLEQIVVNSFDPNDKRCLEGEKIEPSMVGEYVHYMIRFENTGTASAINVVVKDAIDPTMFDVSTFVPLGGSHDYYVRSVEDGNTFEFIHENINLDFNDATNDGYVLFKIKTLPTLSEGDTFNNDAEIYFDFNAPIVTNDFVTTVQSTASVSTITDDSISISPNPTTSGMIQLNAKNAIQSMTVHDLNGRLLNKTSFVSGALNETVNLENLNSGIYLMTVETSEGHVTERVVIE